MNKVLNLVKFFNPSYGLLVVLHLAGLPLGNLLFKCRCHGQKKLIVNNTITVDIGIFLSPKHFSSVRISQTSKKFYNKC